MSDQADHARTALEQVCARGDLARARELYIEDFIDHVDALEFHGQAGIAKSVALYRAVFPDLQIRVEDQTKDGDRVTSRWTLHGSHKGRTVTLPGITISRFEDGKTPRTGRSRTTLSCSAASASAGSRARRTSPRRPAVTGIVGEAPGSGGVAEHVRDARAPRCQPLKRSP